MRIFFVLILALTTHFVLGQDIAGRWTTIDDNTGAKRSVVEITVVNGTATGRIADLYDKSKLKDTCTECTDDRNGKPLVGLDIIRAMTKDGDEWTGGTILDPENGKIYDCKLWVEDGKLQVRGYVAFFFRTQEWIR